MECADDELRGFIITLTRLGSQIAGIETINVDPSYWGKGIALCLLRSTEEKLSALGLKALRLEVSIGNSVAIQLYEKAGFQIISMLPNFYQNHYYGSRNAYRMIKPLTT